jgi:two-component system, OmpR family, response regulator VicR
MTLTLFAESFDGLETFVHELETAGYNVNSVSSKHLLEVKEISETDFVLLYLDGSDSLNKERVAQIKRLTHAPLFVITSDTSEIVKSYYLNIGADGVVTEPIPHIETISRINAMMRRFSDYKSNTNNKIFKLGPLVVYLDDYRVTKAGRDVKLTAREFAILKLLVQHPNTMVSRKKIIDMIYKLDDSTTDNAINIHINRLRKKLSFDESDNLIETVWGLGYRLKNNH